MLGESTAGNSAAFVACRSCGERGSGRKLHESNLRLVAVLYNQYLSAHGGEVPRDADDFRAFTRAGTGRLMTRLRMNRTERACYVAIELGGVSEITEELFLSRLKEPT
jgi:hypothetical protein